MIIDAHTHIYPDAVAKRAISTILKNARGLVDAHTDGTYDNLLASMDYAGVDFSVVLPVATNPGQGRGILEWVKQLQARSSRMIFFSSVHPYDPGYKDLIKETKESGIQGFKFHPDYQGFPGDSREAYRIYEEALNNDLILYFHAGPDLSLPDSDFTFMKELTVFPSWEDSVLIVLALLSASSWTRSISPFGRLTYTRFSLKKKSFSVPPELTYHSIAAISPV
jgi:predicted TIM-barrel fold metal-dependent hydrolase